MSTVSRQMNTRCRLQSYLVALALLPFVALATDDPCGEDGGRDSSSRAECVQQSLAESEARMNSALVSLRVAVSKSPDYDRKTIAQIAQSQTAWKQFRERECEVEYSLPTSASTWKAHQALSCRIGMTEERVLKLAKHLECVQQLGQSCY